MAKYAKKELRDDGVVFGFTDDTELRCVLADIPEHTRLRLMVHGLAQKVGDAYAGAVTLAEAKASAERVYTNLRADVWKEAKAGGGGNLAEAIHRATGKELTECEVIVSKGDAEWKTSARKVPEVAQALAQMALEKVSGKTGDASKLEALFGG